MREENVRKKEESADKKRRKKIFLYAVILVLSVIAVYFLTTYILTITKVINQGYFRINDFVITSTVEVEEVIENGVSEEKVAEDNEIENELEISKELSLNISQKNTFSLLVPKAEEAKIDRIYLSDVKVIDEEEIYYINSGNEEKISNNDLEIKYSEEENEYLLEFSLLNKNILENVKLPDNVDTIVYDGTLLKTLNYDVENLKYHFSARLNIVDSMGRISYTDISLELPKGELGNSGIVIERENLEEYTLKLKQKYLQF
ncbi:MAG: hypothetical protein IJ809_01845 [Clostridia bacterium]|nr:hypothetical protein [Clostridia bacterium]